jgi:hypothetical protein
MPPAAEGVDTPDATVPTPESAPTAAAETDQVDPSLAAPSASETQHADPSFAAPVAPAPDAVAPQFVNPVPSTKGFALAALILGIAAFLTGWTPVLGVILGITAVVLGIVALARRQSKGMAITGLALGAVALIASLVMSFVALAVVANWDEFVAGFEEGLAGEDTTSQPVGETAGGTETTDEPAEVDLTDFTALDDATLAAIVADPEAATGETHIIYGEVQQLDESTGPCSAVIQLDDAQQKTWEGYTTVSWIYAGSGDTECPAFDGLEQYSHVKAWVTVAGVTPTEFDDGTTEDVVTWQVQQYEALPALP